MLTGILIGVVVAGVVHHSVNITIAKIGADQAKADAAVAQANADRWKEKHDVLSAQINDGK